MTKAHEIFRPIVAQVFFFTIILMAGIFLPATVYSQDSSGEMGIVAVVNDEPISLYDLVQRTDLAMASTDIENNAEARSRLLPQILQVMINEKLQLQEAAEKEINISQESIKRAQASIEQQNNIPEGQLKQAIEADGLHYPSLLEQIRAGLSWRLLVQRKAGSLAHISEEEIDEVIADLEDARNSTQYKYAEILIPSSSAEEDTQAKETAQEIFDKLKEGADFRKLAQSFSSKASAFDGGEVPWTEENELEPALKRILPTLTPGFLTQPFQTESGYMVVLFLDKKVAQANNIVIPPRADIARRLRSQKLEQVSRKYATDLRNRAIIDIRIGPNVTPNAQPNS